MFGRQSEDERSKAEALRMAFRRRLVEVLGTTPEDGVASEASHPYLLSDAPSQADCVQVTGRSAQEAAFRLCHESAVK